MDLKYRIKDRVIYPVDAAASAALLSENTDYYLRFEFDDEWDGQMKIVRLRRERAKEYEDITLMDNQDVVQIPAYLMHTGTIVMGVYSPEIATRPFNIRVLPSVLDADVMHEFPDKMLYRELLRIFGDRIDETTLATVALTGLYSDLIDPPVNVSEFANDAGYITNSVPSDLDVTGSISATGDVTDGSGNVLSQKENATEPIESDDWTYIIKSGIFFGWYKSTERTSITSNLNQYTYQSNSSLIIDFPADIELTSLIHADVSVRGSLPTWPIIYGKSVDSISFKLTSTQTQNTQNYDIEAFAVGLI